MTAQNKETYLESMNEEYKQKHYPEGSVFKAHKKAMKLSLIHILLDGAKYLWQGKENTPED